MALVIALVFLLLMTMIGVTAMRTATQQERMAGNMRDRHLALQAAEVALRVGEEEVNAAVVPPSPASGDHYYAEFEHEDTGTDELWWKEFDWDNDAGVKIIDVEGTQGARFVIEELDSVQGQGGVTVTGEALQELFFYRVTARGTGASETSKVLLQSTFKYGEQ